MSRSSSARARALRARRSLSPPAGTAGAGGTRRDNGVPGAQVRPDEPDAVPEEAGAAEPTDEAPGSDVEAVEDTPTAADPTDVEGLGETADAAGVAEPEDGTDSAEDADLETATATEEPEEDAADDTEAAIEAELEKDGSDATATDTTDEEADALDEASDSAEDADSEPALTEAEEAGADPGEAEAVDAEAVDAEERDTEDGTDEVGNEEGEPVDTEGRSGTEAPEDLDTQAGETDLAGAEPAPATADDASPASAPVAAAAPRGRGRHISLAVVLNRVGRALIAAGVIILLFVGYQLWGTNLQEQRSQDKLESSFSDTLARLETVDPSVLAALRGQQASTTTQVGAPPTTPTTISREVFELIAPEEGEPVAVIRIPRIGVERRVVEGTAVDHLRRGPGHYSESPLPGQAGNAAIAGHRTTYGAPFNRIDELAPGDEIQVQTVQGTAIYRVDQEPFVVTPDRTEVLDNHGDNRLTLTSCHPKLSSAKRLIVTAKLETPEFPELPSGEVGPVAADVASTTTLAEGVENPDAPGPVVTVTTTAGLPEETTTSAPPASTTTVPPPTDDTALPRPADDQPDLDQGLAGDRSALPSAIGWGLVTAALAVGVWLLARLADRKLRIPPRGRRLVVYVLASPVLLFFLFLCFENVDRLLPAY